MRLICAQSVSIKGTEYVEVRCNAGYVLSGRNLGIQELGTLAIGATFSQLDCQHRWGECGGWPEDSDYTACSTTSTGNDRCTVAQCIPGDGQYRKAESLLPTSISSLCVHPLPLQDGCICTVPGAMNSKHSRSKATRCMKGSRGIRLSALLKICLAQDPGKSKNAHVRQSHAGHTLKFRMVRLRHRATLPMMRGSPSPGNKSVHSFLVAAPSCLNTKSERLIVTHRALHPFIPQ